MYFMVTFLIHPIFLEEDGEIAADDFPKDCIKELSDRQRYILDLIAEDCTLTSQKISQKISQKEPVTQRTIKMDLADLQRKGLLRREGGRKSGVWVVIKTIE